MSPDEIEVEILDDGTVKSSSGAFSPENHQDAEDFLAGLTTLMGGEAKRERQGHEHHHEKEDQTHKH